MPGMRGLLCSLCLFVLAFPFSPMETSAQDHQEKASGIDYTRPAEHQELEEYEGPSTCADCHEGAVDEVMRSTHYTWKPKWVGGGKYSALQMSAVPINWFGVLNEQKQTAGGCGQCHIGGGPLPKDPTKATEADREKIDCLICHAGTYDTKVRSPKKVSGTWVLPQDRSIEAARSAGRTTQDTCLRCHYVPLSGYKRGAGLKEDVHYKRGLSCTRCHRVEGHRFPGFGPTITREADKRVRCVDCHDITPHKSEALNLHRRVDCRTCHAVEAGGIVYKNGTRDGIWDEKSGTYKFHTKMEKRKPSYFWYDGFSRGPVPKGSIDDPGSRIQPFKKFSGVAPVDAETGDFLWLKLGVFAKTGDVKRAVQAGAEESGRPYSGSWSPKEYDLYFQLSHGITKEHALRCRDCHQPEGVLNFKALGYTEARAKKLSERR